nr:DNA repair protein RecO [uncultured Oscillibacter sp.]
MAGTPYTVDRGVVLRETETKETDKILTLLTWEAGKIGVIARGARRKGCKFAAAAQPLAYSEWTLYQRKDWRYASDASTLDLFSGLRGDLAALSLGCYMAELTEAVCPEDVPAPELLRHLLNGLYALSTLHKPPALVKPAFELRLLCLAGYEPLAEACALCGREDPAEPVLDAAQGVLRCRDCGGGGGRPLCRDSLAALRHIIYGDPKRLYSFRLGEEPLRRLTAAAEAFLYAQLERGLSTLDFYKSIL